MLTSWSIGGISSVTKSFLSSTKSTSVIWTLSVICGGEIDSSIDEVVVDGIVVDSSVTAGDDCVEGLSSIPVGV